MRYEAEIARLDGMSPAGAIRLAAAVGVRLDLLSIFPFMGRQVPEFGFAELREAVILGYRLFYLLDGDGITVTSFFHGAISLEDE